MISDNTSFQHWLHACVTLPYAPRVLEFHVVGCVYCLQCYWCNARYICGKISWTYLLNFSIIAKLCLNIGLISFLLVWERQPNYFVVFTVAVLYMWGMYDGSWTPPSCSKYTVKSHFAAASIIRPPHYSGHLKQVPNIVLKYFPTLLIRPLHYYGQHFWFWR